MPIIIVRRCAALAFVILLAWPAGQASAQGERFAVPFTQAVEATLDGSQPSDLAVDAIRTVPDEALPKFSEWFDANAHRMPPLYLFTYAKRVFDLNPQLGARWFFAGRTRLFYDVLRCRDSTVFERVIEVDAILEDIVKFIQGNPKVGAKAGEWSLDWDSRNDLTERPEALLKFCLTGTKGRALVDKLAEAKNRSGSAILEAPLPDAVKESDWVIPRSQYGAARGESYAITQRVIDQLTGAAQPANPPSGGE